MKWLPFTLILICKLLTGCLNDHEFYNLGSGFKYGYFDSKETLNVFFNDQGIVHGICYEVKWNDNYVLICYLPYDSSAHLQKEMKYVLINKNKYENDPMQLDSKGVIFQTSSDSVDAYITKLNLRFLNSKGLSP